MRDSDNPGSDANQRALRAGLEAKLRGTPDFTEPGDGTARSGQSQSVSSSDATRIQLVAHADFPTKFGQFTLFGFHDLKDGKEHTAVVRGDVRGQENVPVRVHSECHTGDVWGSLRCDCREQLEAALRYISRQQFGAVVYVKQEGRGIGLLNKIKAYRLQDLGLDTIEANQYLGFPAENRDYAAAAEIIRLLGIESIHLLTNNPAKLDGLRTTGVVVTERIPIVIEANDHNRRYLKTKRERMGHLL